MGSNPSPTGSPIEGKNWHQEVVTRSPSREAIRNEFYFKLARLRLSTDPDTVLDDPTASGLKTLQDLQGIPNFSRTVNPNAETFQKGKGWTLYECLNSYFKNQAGVTDPDIKRREVGLTLYYLTKQNAENGRPINVDYLNAKWTILIDSGRLYVTDANGNFKVNGAYLRKPTEEPEAVTPVPDTVPAPQPRVVPQETVRLQPPPSAPSTPAPVQPAPAPPSTGSRTSAPATPPPPASSRGPRTSAPATPPRPSSHGPRTSPPVSPPPPSRIPTWNPRTSPPATPPRPSSSSGMRTSPPATPPPPQNQP